MSYTPPLNGGRINMTVGGNTAGAGALASTGTVTLAGGNNITLSQNGNAITISGGAGGGAGTNTLGISNLGSTAGTSGVISGSALQLALAGGNNITLSQSVNASSATITVSGPTQTNQSIGLYATGNTAGTSTGSADARSLSFNALSGVTLDMTNNQVNVSVQPPIRIGVSTGGNTAGNTGTVIRSYILAGNNAVSLSQSTAAGGVATVTIDAPTQTVQTQNLHNVTLSGNTAGAMAQVSSGTLTLAGGNNITLSQNGNAVTISGANGGGAGFTAGMSNIGNTSGTTGMATNQLVFAGGDNITLSQSTGAGGNTITISGGGGAGNTTFATMWFPYNEGVNVAGQAGQASLGFVPVPTPSVGEEVQVDRVVFPVYFTNASNTTGSLSASLWFGLYTRNDSSLSLAHSQSTSVSLGYAGNNSSASQRGIRLLTMGWSTTIPDGRYFVGIVSRTTTAGANATLSQMLVSQLNSNVSGMWDEASNATVQWPIGIGYYSATTSAMPGSVAFSQLRGSNSLAARPPSWHMINGTV